MRRGVPVAMNSGNGNGTGHVGPERRFSFPPAAGPDEGSSLLRAVIVLRRRWWVLLLGCIVTGGVATAFAMTRPRSFRSEATIEVGPDKPLMHADGLGDSVTRSAHLWENHFRTQESLLRRKGLLAAVVESLPPERVARYKAAPDPALKLSEDLEIDTVPSTFLIRISLVHDRPETGPDIVNKLLALFIEDSNRRLTELKNGVLDMLNKESLPVIKQRVDEAEQALQAFHAKVGFGDLEEQYSSLLAEKRRFHDRLLAVRMRAIELKSSPAPRLEDIKEDPGPFLDDPTGSDQRAVSRPAMEARRTELELELARQKATLKDGHPVVVALQQQLEVVKGLIEGAAKAEVARRERILKSILETRARDLASAEEEERALDAEEKLMSDRIVKARGLLSQYKNLELELIASRDLYNSYLKKQGEVKAISGAGVTSVRIVDQARTPQEQAPKPQLILAVGCVIGLLLGTLAVLVVEQLDDRVPSPREAETALGLDLLTVIPRLPSPAATAHLPLIPEDDPVTAPLEPFRRLRSEVASRLQGLQGPKVVAIVSPNYGEGKSTIAINLARVLALEGKRVLLMDLDLRQPSLKSLLGNRTAPGLEEYLQGKANLERCIQPSRVPGVDVFGASWEFEGSAEVSGTTRFRAVWSAVRSNHDYVIVDTSPVNSVSEAAVLASHADGTLFVMEERRTSIRDALAALRRIGNHGVRPLGLVVNRSQTGHYPRPEPERPRSEIDRLNSQKRAGIGVD